MVSATRLAQPQGQTLESRMVCATLSCFFLEGEHSEFHQARPARKTDAFRQLLDKSSDVKPH